MTDIPDIVEYYLELQLFFNLFGEIIQVINILTSRVSNSASLEFHTIFFFPFLAKTLFKRAKSEYGYLGGSPPNYEIFGLPHIPFSPFSKLSSYLCRPTCVPPLSWLHLED